jgi:hypothetical protein
MVLNEIEEIIIIVDVNYETMKEIIRVIKINK